MTVAAFPNSRQPGRQLPIRDREVVDALARKNRIPGSFQLMLAMYVLLTGTLPVIVQAIGYGVSGGAGSEFALAMATGLAVDLLMLLPVIVLASHPLGILHPLVIAILLWPLLTHMPNVIEDWGGWAGVLGGSPVAAPQYQTLPGRAASYIWTATAHLNVIRIIALVSAYVGFWILRGKSNLTRLPNPIPSTSSVRTMMISLMAVSFFVLIFFVKLRGGVNAHLTSLGAGRFNELSGFGAVLLIIDLGATALFIWAASDPKEIKRPIFIAALAGVSAAAFISNGSRGGALEVPLMVGLIWALRTRKIPWKIAIALIPFMFVSIGFMGAIRTSAWSEQTAATTVENSNWTQSFERAELEVIGRNAASANVPVVARGFELTGGPLLGKSYVSAITTFIPRPLWPTKPRGVGQLYARVFLGASLSGTSIPVNPEVEMYWNFGIPGVILLSIAYGALLRIAFQMYWRRYPNPFATVTYLYFLAYFQFSSDRLTGLEQSLVLVLVCYFMVSMFISRHQLAAEALRGTGTARSSRFLTSRS